MEYETWPAAPMAALRPFDQLVGPIWYQILITGRPADSRYAERLVDAVLDGAFTTAKQRSGP